MAWLSALKQYFFRRSLRERLGASKHHGSVMNYSNARYIGIWFDGSNREDFAQIDAFARKLAAKGKKVEVLGYLDKVKKLEDIPFEYIDPKEVTWAGVPSQSVLNEWATKPYDLLLCLHPRSCTTLEYMAAMSQAKCRVGRYADDTVECYDLMVMGAADLAKMTKQIDQLLNEMNKKQQQNAA